MTVHQNGRAVGLRRWIAPVVLLGTLTAGGADTGRGGEGSGWGDAPARVDLTIAAGEIGFEREPAR